MPVEQLKPLPSFNIDLSCLVIGKAMIKREANPETMSSCALLNLFRQSNCMCDRTKPRLKLRYQISSVPLLKQLHEVAVDFVLFYLHKPANLACSTYGMLIKLEKHSCVKAVEATYTMTTVQSSFLHTECK